MTIYQGIVRGGSRVVHSDRLDEFFREFIEYHKGKAKTSNFNKDIFPFKEGKKATNYHPHNPEKDGYGAIFYLNLDNDKTKKPIVYGERPRGGETSFDYSTGGDLGINVSKALKIKKEEPLRSSKGKQGNQQKDKIEKVLQDIWTTGEIKDTYGLDLNGPANQQQNKENQETNSSIENFTQANSPNLTNTSKQPNQANNKTGGIVGSLVLVSLVVGLIIWLIFKKKVKK